jgi:rhodanese-related sulfurtransferase
MRLLISGAVIRLVAAVDVFTHRLSAVITATANFEIIGLEALSAFRSSVPGRSMPLQASRTARTSPRRLPVTNSHCSSKPALVGFLAVAMTALQMGNALGQSSQDIMKGTLAQPSEKTAEVSTEELKSILAERSATVFDARPHLEYAISHIPGALNVAPKAGVPMSLYVSDVAEIGRVLGDRKDAAIVLYCNGPFCGKSKRLAEELLAAGYSNVRRYQLGAPVWRALVGVMQIEPDGLRYVRENDKTAVFFDVRSAEEFAAGSISGARHLPREEVVKAKDDGRLPMEDHNTRIIVMGRDSAQARAAAEEIAKNAFHNVSYYGGKISDLKTASN